MLPSISKAPIRIMFRNTFMYRDFQKGSFQVKKHALALIDEEKFQLDRGDIPYFFRYLDSSVVYYYHKQNQATQVEVPNELKKLYLDNLINFKNSQVSHNNITTLKKAGVLQIIKQLADGQLGEGYYNGFRIKITETEITAMCTNGEELICDL